MNGNSFLKEIGRSYIVSSFIPASLFVFLLVFLFRDFVPNWALNRLQGSILFIDVSLAFVATFTFWIAFALYSSQDSITKLFEGYYFPFFLFFLRNILIDIQRIRLWFKTRQIKKYLYYLSDQRIYQEELEELKSAALADFQDVELEAPLDPHILLPTRLGNVLRASEIYSDEHYGIDSITMWPRLYSYLPHSIKDDLEKVNNHLAFLLNSAILIAFVATLSFSLAVAQNFCLSGSVTFTFCSSSIWQKGFRHFTYISYYLVSAIGFVATYSLYCLAVNTAKTYGMYVRTAFDLYRDRLLQRLKHKLTHKLDDEKESWKKIGDFYVAGNYFGEVKFGNEKGPSRMRIGPRLVIAGCLAVGFVYKLTKNLTMGGNRDRN